MATIASAHNLWERSLASEAEELHRKLCEAPERRGRPECAAYLAAHPAHDAAGDLARARADLDGAMATIASAHKLWEGSLAAEADELHRKLCEAPERRGRQECAAFLAAHSGNDAVDPEAMRLRMASLKAEHAVWDRDFSKEADDLHRKLCEDPERHDRPDCLRFLSASAARAAEAPPAAPGAGAEALSPSPAAPRELHWSSVAHWAAARPQKLRGGSAGGLAVVEPGVLRASRWSGMIPGVSCIAAVPRHGTSATQVEEVVREFHAQSYEGRRQLVLVYHYEDEEAAAQVRQLADGHHIKGSAARGPAAEYPSAASLRFGAWASDGEIVAHWDFEERYSPERLSLQVRALAYANRPAALLVPEEGAGASNFTETSLLGERLWMNEHWQPLLKEQLAVLKGVEAHHIAHVRAGADLLPQRRAAPEVCDGIADKVPEPLMGAVEGKLAEALGEELAARFHLLATKRAETAEKLRTICGEARAEQSEEQRLRLRVAAQRIAAIREELDSHFTRLGELYSAAGEP
mmetsp:Transcript_107826/g.311557  ORF Transcript_107826/g.311557 Transcript_107826/m.311557 type:complete len:522 (-) Transcript_107826:77-1642(-)